MAPRSFRALLHGPGCLVLAAVYDARAASLAARAGVRAVGLGSLRGAASRLGGLPEYQCLERRYATDGEAAMETKTP